MKKKKIISCIRKFLSSTCTGSGSHITDQPIKSDVREEYANAFRTQSYLDFWTRVLALNDAQPTAQLPVETTTAARLPSYRLFVEHLLDPDQPTISRILDSAHHGPRPKYYSLLTDYFSHTADTSRLCGRLLKVIDHIRIKHRPLKITLLSLESAEISQPVLGHLVEFSNAHNPFEPSGSSTRDRVRAGQNRCSKLLKQLEHSRERARAKLRRVRYLRHGSTGLMVALTASLTVIIVTHGIALIVVMTGLLVAPTELANKSRKLVKEVAELEVAAKGTYTLNRDMDTIGRLIIRLNQELEHMKAMAKFWVEWEEDDSGRRRRRHRRRQSASDEVAHQLKRSYLNFSQQLDELEEHLYLCFMTINRARNLVVREILGSGQPVITPSIFS